MGHLILLILARVVKKYFTMLPYFMLAFFIKPLEANYFSILFYVPGVNNAHLFMINGTDIF